MKLRLLTLLFASIMLLSCNNDKEILNTLNDYNISMESDGYHFGETLNIPQEVREHAESITISFGDKETSKLVIDPAYFSLGENAVTFNIKKKGGEVITQDATINVYAKNPEAQLTYEIVQEYPHDPTNFVQGFQLEGNMIYESEGNLGESRIMKYQLGTTNAIAETPQADDVFSEGCTIVGDKIYQLTWKNKKIFVYDKKSLKFLREYDYPNVMIEGWGLTYDGKNLIASDGTSNIYFLDVDNPSKVTKTISVAGHKEAFDYINELEFHQGFIYANVWQKPIVLKINPANGEVVARLDFSAIVKENTQDPTNDVLNGITFKGDNMLITGKLWSKIYEVSIK